MGYYIKKLFNKNSSPNWKVQFISYKKEHIKNTAAKFPKKTWDIPKDRWQSLGFLRSMTIDQARNRQRQLNAQLSLTALESRKLAIKDNLKKFDLVMEAFLPKELKAEFERRYFYERRLSRVKSNREMSHWRAAQKIIKEIQLDPSDWAEESHRFYDCLYSRKYSFSYCNRILSILNQWGDFVCRKLGKPFFRILPPRGREKSRLLDGYFMKQGRYCRQSDPITPEKLEQVKNSFTQNQLNWLKISVWLGLRPKEIDQLNDKKSYKILKDETGLPILWVYQSKLTSIPFKYRWKLIPLFLKEQRKILKIIRARKFTRPLVKSVKKEFGPNTTLYGGRKGFADLMLSRNQDFINISQWMGHSTLQRTWANYKNRLMVHHT